MPNKPNAFSIFISEFSRKHGQDRSYKWSAMDEASKVWESLPQEEKEYYKEKAKQINGNKKADPVRPNIASRAQNPCKITNGAPNTKKVIYSYSLTNPEIKNFRNLCIDKFMNIAHKSWKNNTKELKVMPLVFMCVSCLQNVPLIRDDNYMGIEIDVDNIPDSINYISLQKPNCVPVEITLMEYSLREGLKYCYHEFIKPGIIPLGYKFEAIKSGTDTNQIPPTGHPKAKPIVDIMRQLSLIGSDYMLRNIPVYVISNQFENITQSLTYMEHLSGIKNQFSKIFYIESLIKDLMFCCKYKDLQNSVQQLDIQNIIESVGYLYNEEIRCQYHYDLQCRFCSLRECLSYGHFLAEHITSLFDIVNTDAHTPDAKFANNNNYIIE